MAQVLIGQQGLISILPQLQSPCKICLASKVLVDQLLGQPATGMSLEGPVFHMGTSIGLPGTAGRGHSLGSHAAHSVPNGSLVGAASCCLQGPGEQRPMWSSWSEIIGGGWQVAHRTQAASVTTRFDFATTPVAAKKNVPTSRAHVCPVHQEERPRAS